MPLILASASPRRAELLRNAKIAFAVEPSQIPEIALPGDTPPALAMRLAREKAGALQEKHPEQFILGADTVVVVDQQVLGKPLDGDDALRMLRLLSGRTHQVLTAVCLLGPGKQEDIRSETTVVTFAAVTDSEIRDYIKSGDCMDKAGAYGIQGLPSRWIPKIEGDYFNVVGLPVALVWNMLRQHGVT